MFLIILQHQHRNKTEVSGATSKNIFISLKNADKLKIEISLIGYIITFVALAKQKTVMEKLQCKHTNIDITIK